MNSSVLQPEPDVQPVASKSDLRPSLILLFLALLVLGLLWFRLIDHLRVEWTVNPQYTYGWAVAFLCAYLLWRADRNDALEIQRKGAKTQSRKDIDPTTNCADEPSFGFRHRSPLNLLEPLRLCVFALKKCREWCQPVETHEAGRNCLTTNANEPGPQVIGIIALLAAFCYAPTRLIQEANPEWRLVSWALALEVLAITFWLITSFPLHVSRITPLSRRSEAKADYSPSSALHARRLLPALLFFLVAVPWPTPIEAPLIRGLTAANCSATIELLSWLGVPALQHGNVIEVGGGLVGIDDACSGIRSVQATLMLSLFFGEFYRLTAWKRLGLCLAGFGLSFAFNVARTTLLTTVAAHRGAEAIAHWHDPAGVAILLACFFCLWLIAKQAKSASEHDWERRHPCRRDACNQKNAGRDAGAPRKTSRLPIILLLVWLLAMEASTELWYRWHELRLPAPVTWTIALPRHNPSLRSIPLSPQTRQLLRCDEAVNAGWEDAGGRPWQAIFLRWASGRTAVHLAEGHTPEVCLTAAGNELVSRSDLRTMSCDGLTIPFRLYTFGNGPARLHVLYCLWRDRAPGQNIATNELNWRNRLAPVLNGMRHSGERSLELALWGYLDDNEAEAALEQEFRDLIQPPPASNAVAALST